MSLERAIEAACAEVGIEPPQRLAPPGEWARTRVEGKGRGNRSGRVLIREDGRGGVVWNWATGQTAKFTTQGATDAERRAFAPDPEAVRRKAEARAAAEATAARIVSACDLAEHPYLAAKGFPTERGLVIERHALSGLTEPQRAALPDGDGPMLIVPGRIGGRVATVQFITPDGAKKNLRDAPMGGAAHRIATGRETWICEGIATALSVRAALRMLGRSATVLSAFSASNVAQVAQEIGGSIVAADHDRPVQQFDGLGTGEWWARATGRVWVMPPALGDFNDMHQRDGLRAVMLALREIRGG